MNLLYLYLIGYFKIYADAENALLIHGRRRRAHSLHYKKATSGRARIYNKTARLMLFLLHVMNLAQVKFVRAGYTSALAQVRKKDRFNRYAVIFL